MKDTSLNRRANEISDFVTLLESELGLKVIINDRYSVLENTPLKKLKNINAWHLNGFCTAIKSNPQLHGICIHKRNLFETALCPEEPTETCCYCGVFELAQSVPFNSVNYLTVYFSQMQKELPLRTANTLAKKAGLSAEELISLYSKELISKPESELRFLKIYLQTLCSLLDGFLNSLFSTENTKIFNGNTTESNYIAQALDYISAHYSEKISVGSVAAHCNLAPSYLQHLFIKLRSNGIGKEIQKIKMQYAAELLYTTQHSVRDIAYLCGFENSDYFSYAFKRIYKVTPTQYRKEKK